MFWVPLTDRIRQVINDFPSFLFSKVAIDECVKANEIASFTLGIKISLETPIMDTFNTFNTVN